MAESIGGGMTLSYAVELLVEFIFVAGVLQGQTEFPVLVFEPLLFSSEGPYLFAQVLHEIVLEAVLPEGGLLFVCIPEPDLFFGNFQHGGDSGHMLRIQTGFTSFYFPESSDGHSYSFGQFALSETALLAKIPNIEKSLFHSSKIKGSDQKENKPKINKNNQKLISYTKSAQNKVLTPGISGCFYKLQVNFSSLPPKRMHYEDNRKILC